MKNLLIIGGGNMGLAIALGITKKGVKKNNILLIEKNIKRRNYLKKLKFTVSDNACTQLKKYSKRLTAIIIAVKPQDIKETLLPLNKFIPKNTIVISIAAGVTLKSISNLLPTKQPIARVMPNTPCQVGYGMSAMAFNKYTTKKHKEITNKTFSSIGSTTELSEKFFDAAGAVNGSGPAYFCYLIESLIQGGIKLGLSKATASKLALQTSIGTNLLLQKRNMHPEELRKAVTSPKGITEAALKIYKKRGFTDIVYNGVLAAKKRSIELGKTEVSGKET